MKKNINEILEDYKKIYPNKEWETPKLILETFETCDIELNNNTIIYLAFITWNYELYCHKQMSDNNCKLSPYVKASCIMYVINELLTKICKKGNATIAIIAAFKILDNDLGNNYLEEFLANNKFSNKLITFYLHNKNLIK